MLETVGIWESKPALTPWVWWGLPEQRRQEVRFLPTTCPADWQGKPLDVLVISPNAPVIQAANMPPCRLLLFPGAACAQVGAFPAQCVVSYGTSPKDTLTISSLDAQRMGVALQREVVTTEEDIVERQEFLLPCPPELPPLSFLACVGLQLLLGIPPDEICPKLQE